MSLIILASLIFFCSCNVTSICKQAKTTHPKSSQALSSIERKELEFFLRTLFRKSSFPYTLFGDKPLSFYDYFHVLILPGTMKPVDKWYLYRPEKMHLLYEKYKKYLTSNKYLIIDQLFISKKFPTSGMVHDFLILNKAAILRIVDEHIVLFKERLGSNMTGEILWKDFQSGRSILSDVLKEDELLWGILLGFGRHNSQLYIQNEEQLDAFDRKLFIDQIPLPAFHCDLCHTETEQLRQDYEQTQKLITEIYKSPDFLDIVLQRLQE